MSSFNTNSEYVPGWSQLIRDSRRALRKYIEFHKDFPDGIFGSYVLTDNFFNLSNRADDRVVFYFLVGEGYIELIDVEGSGGTRKNYRLTSAGYVFLQKKFWEEFVDENRHKIAYDLIKGIFSVVLPAAVTGFVFSFTWHLATGLTALIFHAH